MKVLCWLWLVLPSCVGSSDYGSSQMASLWPDISASCTSDSGSSCACLVPEGSRATYMGEAFVTTPSSTRRHTLQVHVARPRGFACLHYPAGSGGNLTRSQHGESKMSAAGKSCQLVGHLSALWPGLLQHLPYARGVETFSPRPRGVGPGSDRIHRVHTLYGLHRIPALYVYIYIHTYIYTYIYVYVYMCI